MQGRGQNLAHLDQLSRASGQVDESLFVIQTVLFYKM